MKFLRLDLLAYGPFTKHTLELPASGPNLHLIYGPNEAGKSTTLRAVTGFLYTIEKNTPDAHRHEMNELRIGGRLQHSTGAEREYVRRKGSGVTLLDPSGAPADEAEFRSWLSVADRDQFQLMFGLSHEQLREAGEALSKAEGAAGEMLFGAALGGASLQQTLLQLRVEAARLLSTGGGAGLVHKSLQAYRERLRQAKLLAMPAREWDRLQDERHEAEQDRERTSAEIVALSTERARLERLRRALPHLHRREVALGARGALGVVKPLRVEIPQLRTELQRELSAAELDLGQARIKVESRELELAGLQVPEGLQGASERIKQLTESLGKYKDELGALPRVKQEVIAFANQEKEILRDLNQASLPLTEVGSIAVEEAAVKRIRAQQKLGAGLQERLAQLQSQQTRGQVAIEQRQQDLAASPAPRDVRLLQATYTRLKPSHHLDQQLRDALASRAQAQDDAREAASALEPWTISAESTSSVPREEAITAVEDEASARTTERKQLGKNLRKVEEEVEEVERAIDKLNATGELPSEAQLKATRAKRDKGWERVLRAWEEKVGVEFADPKDAANRPLAQVYSEAVEAADELADRLRAESARVTKHEGQLEKFQEAKAKRKETQGELEQLEDLEKKQTQSWKRLWTGCGIEPGSPREMRAWRGRFDTWLAAVRSEREAERQVEKVERDLGESQRALEAALAEAGLQAPERTPWATLLGRVETAVDEAELLAVQRDRLEADLRQLRGTQGTVEADLQAAEKQLAAWHENWAASMVRLRLPDKATDEEANSVLEGLAALFKLEDSRQRQEKRIKAILHEKDAFEALVGELAQALAPDLGGSTVEVADGLIHRHGEAMRLAEQARVLQAQLPQVKADRESAALRVEHAGKRVQELLADCGCTTLEEVEREEGRTEQARTLDAERADAEARLLDGADGWTVEALQEAALGAEAGALEQGSLQAAEQLKAAEARQQEQLRKIGALENRASQFAAGDEAARLLGEAHEHLALARGHAERCARLRLAATVLERAIEGYRQKNQGAILERANQLFRRLTLGSYEEIRPVVEGGKALLRCVRKGQVVDAASALSDGACDQLFLALRLASLEHHLSAQEPMPLVLDDIFIQFDDDRARAGLQILAEVAQKTQVLLLTHHARNLELARQVLKAEQWKEHQLVRAIGDGGTTTGAPG